MNKEEKINNKVLNELFKDHSLMLALKTKEFMDLHKSKLSTPHMLQIITASAMRFFVTNVAYNVSVTKKNDRSSYLEKIKATILEALKEIEDEQK